MSKQQQLFDTDPPPWELDDRADWLVARVVFAQNPYGPYDYSVPHTCAGSLRPGMRVLVPLGRGNRTLEGWCIQLIRPEDKAPDLLPIHKMKSVQRVIDDSTLVPGTLLQLAAWISWRWLCPVGKAIKAIVPTGVRSRSNLRQVKFVSMSDAYQRGEVAATISPKQQVVLDMLDYHGPMLATELAAAAKCTLAPINTLVKHGVLRFSTQQLEKNAFATRLEEPPERLQLNPEQRHALDEIVKAVRGEAFASLVLHGITGSGKTEVYIKAIEEVVSFGRQAIVLVPEISLTPQTRRRFRARFDRVSVLHSNMTAPERAWHWRQIAAGKIQVVIGARSAIFAPTPRPGLIVLDEEHDASFKQDNIPRYHARDVASWRAEHEQVPILLGSATPALETWHGIKTGQHQLLTLPKRILERPLPPVTIVDLRLQNMSGIKSRGAISRQLYNAMKQELELGHQVILLLNRRGYSTTVQCSACGEVKNCDHCAIPMTHHRDKELIVCHYCDAHLPTPRNCPSCGSSSILFSGVGTQKLEYEIQARFPNHPCTRMDTDSMRKPGSHEEVLKEFREGKISILLGTQMIAKGLDFPNVTLVGVINADTALHLQDFRAAERTFTLVTQVAGRSGRGAQGGRVIVQTYRPQHPAIVAAADHDYVRFADEELKQRLDLDYPPGGCMARVIVRGESESLADSCTQQLAEHAKRLNDTESPVKIIGPAPAPIPKLRGNYRFHFFAQANDWQPVHRLMQQLQADQPGWDDVQYVIDIDPYDLM